MKTKTFFFSLLTAGAVLFCGVTAPIPAIGQAQSTDNLLGVVVMVNGKTIKIKGYCIYVKDGKELRKELEKDNAWGWNFRGEYIKEVKIQKVSGDASYRLFVMEGQDSDSGQPIFESGIINSTEPVIFRRKR